MPEEKADRTDKKATSQFVADEIKESVQQGAEIASAANDKAMAAIEKANAAQLDSAKFMAKLFGVLFVLSLLTNLALVSGLLKQNLSVTEEGVTISQPKPGTP